jgi:probable addiction module antidote protein
MPLETTRWDVVDHLRTPEDQAAYLEAAFEDGDPDLIVAAIGDIARAQGIARIAEATKLSRETLSNIFKPGGNPTLATLTSVMREIGFKLAAERR